VKLRFGVLAVQSEAKSHHSIPSDTHHRMSPAIEILIYSTLDHQPSTQVVNLVDGFDHAFVADKYVAAVVEDAAVSDAVLILAVVVVEVVLVEKKVVAALVAADTAASG